MSNLQQVEEKIKAALAGADIEAVRIIIFYLFLKMQFINYFGEDFTYYSQIKAKLGGCALPDGSVPFSDLTPILSDLGLSDQEILTLARHFKANPEITLEIENTVRLAQEKLRKRVSSNFKNRKIHAYFRFLMIFQDLTAL